MPDIKQLRCCATITLLSLLGGLSAVAGEDARNVILFIGDGMDDQQVTIARNYLVGATGRLTLDSMPMRGSSQVLTVDEQGNTVYVADSANSATAMATGKVTSRGRIATTAGTDTPIGTIVELGETVGFRSGLVSTASVTDATPAAFVAHINMRFCENPEAMIDVDLGGFATANCPQHLKSNGGLGSISEQLAGSDLDVILGGGSKHFEVNAENRDITVLELAQERGFHTISKASEMTQVPQEKPLLGLFSPSTMPVMLRGENGREAEQPQPNWLNQVHRYLGKVTLPEPMTCEPNPDFVDMPTLKQMTDLALQHLRNDKGFFLMIESASIDKQSHERKPCGSIGELDQLNQALDSALAFAADNPNTLILVTADHGQAAQMIPETSLFAAFGVPVYTPGKVARIRTPEGSLMAVNYATNNFPYEEHTGTAVPVYGNDQAVGRVPAMITQPDIFWISRNYLLGK